MWARAGLKPAPAAVLCHPSRRPGFHYSIVDIPRKRSACPRRGDTSGRRCRCASALALGCYCGTCVTVLSSAGWLEFWGGGLEDGLWRPRGPFLPFHPHPRFKPGAGSSPLPSRERGYCPTAPPRASPAFASLRVPFALRKGRATMRVASASYGDGVAWFGIGVIIRVAILNWRFEYVRYDGSDWVG